MTTDALVPPPVYTISGPGPYPIPHGWQSEAEFGVIARPVAGADVSLTLGVHYSLSAAGPVASGDLTLTGATAALFDGGKLVIVRETAQEQGFAGANAIDRGLERQLDRTMQAVQDVGRLFDRTLRLPEGYAPAALAPVPGATLIFGPDGSFAAGPAVSAADFSAALATRAQLIAAAAVATFEAGAVAVAGGVFYLFDDASTILPNLPGWRPLGPATPFHFGAVGDGEATEDAALAAMRAASGTAEIDLLGLTYRVTAVPAGAWRNGYFRIFNYEGSLPALIPARGAIPRSRINLTGQRAYSAWAQDNAHVWRDLVYIFFSQGTEHALGFMNTASMVRRAGVWRGPVQHVVDYADTHWVSAAGVIDGVQLMFRRDDSTPDYKLFVRRLPARVEMTDTIRTTNGASTFRIRWADIPAAYRDAMGVRAGMSAVFTSVDNVGGLTISGSYVVASVDATEITFPHGSAATSNAVGGGEFSVAFPETAFAELAVDATTVGQAIQAQRTGATQSNIHSFAPGGDATGTCFVGVGRTAGTVKAGVAKLTGLLTASPTVAWWRELTGADDDHTEPTIWRDPADGYLYGFLRSQELTTPPAFWWSADELATAATVTSGPGSGFMWQSPISLVGVGDDLWALASASRTGDGDSVGAVAAEVDIYLGRATKAAARSGGFGAFEWRVVDRVRFANHNFGAANVVGLPSITADGRWLHLFYGEEADGVGTVGGGVASEAHIQHMKIPHGAEQGLVVADQVRDLGAFHLAVRGLPAVANGGYLTFETIVSSTVPCFDTATGYFTAPETGLFEFDLTVTYGVGTTGERFCDLVTVADAAKTSIFWAVGAAPATGAEGQVTGNTRFPVPLVAGERVRFKVTSPDGARDSTARSHLFIRRLS